MRRLVGLPGLVSAWNQSEKRTDIPAFFARETPGAA
jgi:hypothetical protein